MDITVKCPICHNQVPKENRYCLICGHDFSKDATESTTEESTKTLTDSPAPYDGPRYCPRGHDVPDPSLGFCPTCGSLLVNEPVGSYASVDPPDSNPPPAIRICSNCGYPCDDPDFRVCPQCGYAFDGTNSVDNGSAKPSEWKCAICGTFNKPDTSFCIECGKVKGSIPVEEKGLGDSGDGHVPTGMRPPTDGDL